LHPLRSRVIERTFPGRALERIEGRAAVAPVSQAAGSLLTFAEGSVRFREHVRRDAPFAEDIRSLLEVGSAVPVADFQHAARVRVAVRDDYAALFGRVDAVLLPNSPISERPHGIDEFDGTPLIPFTFSGKLHRPTCDRLSMRLHHFRHAGRRPADGLGQH
jgi:aspartyl-tRNA(Asn)/glutamyl-tRNA(Gln) amidotransferase subunit A